MTQPSPPPSPYLTVREAAEYLHLNEKKVYALVREGAIPATKATGKWLFPRELVDRWMVESSHGGVLADRLLVGGSDDPWLAAAMLRLADELGAEGLAAYGPTGSRPGLELLARRRIDACALHWGPAELADRLHPGLLRAVPGHAHWVLVRLARREQGILLGSAANGAGSLDTLVAGPHRWAIRRPGAGSQHFFENALMAKGVRLDETRVTGIALSEREAAAWVSTGRCDCAPGPRAAAGEFGLGFLPLGWECFDLALPRAVYFRKLFQRLLEMLGSGSLREWAASLGGYDLEPMGRLVAIPSE